MFDIGLQEVLIILVIALVIFGPKRLPEIGKTFGRSLREFRRASSGIREELERGLNDDDEEPFTGVFPAKTVTPSSGAGLGGGASQDGALPNGQNGQASSGSSSGTGIGPAD